MIPEEKTQAVTRALLEAFNTPTFEDLKVISTGQSFSNVRVFRITVQGTRYLLRIIMRKDDPTDHFTCALSRPAPM